MERMKALKEEFISLVENQMNDIEHVNAKELGIAVDIIKDLTEAMYYCTVIKAMEEKGTIHTTNTVIT